MGDIVNIWGALAALIISIFLILKKVPPVYGMMTGALLGGLIGGVGMLNSILLMTEGAQGLMPAILRVLSAGVLAGVLIESGATKVIAETLIKKIGESKALLALSVATFILTAVGIFVDVAIITVAPIAVSIAKRMRFSRSSILIAMVGGGKSGNIISPNPNAIAASDAFEIPLTSLMMAGIIPAIFGMLATAFISVKLQDRGSKIDFMEEPESIQRELPKFWQAMTAPIVAILLLSLRPIAGIIIDPLIALPVGGFAGVIAMGRLKKFKSFVISGLDNMSSTAIMLLGTGALVGIIGNSDLHTNITSILNVSGLPAYLLAPISGALMSMATASTTAATSVASSVFGPTIIDLGVSALAGAAMIHAGAMVLDHMPHGGFFHVTGSSVNMEIRERLKLLQFETLIGLTLAVVSTIIYGVLMF